MHPKPTAGCQISTLIFGFGRWVSINIPWKIYQERQSSCPPGVWIKDIARFINWLKCLCGIMHLKPTAGCQISTLIFGFGRTVSMHIPWKIYQGRQSSCPLGVKIKGIARVFNWLKCLGGIMHLKPTAGCQISTLLFENKLWRGLYKYPMTNISRTAKFFHTLGLS
jgi:accessory gene regulator protein AgrB